MHVRSLGIGVFVAGLCLFRLAFLQAQSDASAKTEFGKRTQAWTTSRVSGTPDKPLPLTIEPAFKNLKFNDPMQIRWQADTERYFVCELGAKIWSFPHDENASQPDLVVDLKRDIKSFDSEKTRGCENTYSIAFDPNFKENRYIYVCMIFNSINEKPFYEGSRISRFEVSRTEPPTIDVSTELPIITWLVGGHNGCDMVFDNAGCLLISTGDATSPVPPDGLNTGQDCSDLLSSILRIDVRHATREKPYTIPTDNPFIDRAGVRPEIWAFGLRNPWRIAYDRPTGELWLGDVGWEKWEMVHRIVRGGNYGWAVREGGELLQPNAPIGPAPILPPRVTMSHADSASVTGGFIYRGNKLKQLLGQYIFGDWVNGRIWTVPLDENSPHTEVASGQLRIIAFEPDRDGEPLIVNHLTDTTMFRLVPNAKYETELSASQNFPTKLSQTGIFSDVAAQVPAPGVRKFQINMPQWQDHAAGSHYLAVPGTESVTVYKDPQPVGVLAMFNSRMQYPTGTVLAKTLSIKMPVANKPEAERKVETQILHFDGRLWRGYSYLWNETQTDAELVAAQGAEITLPKTGQRWRIHSRTECMQCHNPWPETTLAFNPEQLYRADQGAQSEWLKLVREGFVVTKETAEKKITPEKCVRTALHSQPGDLAAYARAYLHVNCSHCHQNGAGAGVTLSLRIQDNNEAMQAIGKLPAKGDFGIQHSRIIAPGAPSRSALVYRMASSSAGRMPHIGSREVDFASLAVVSEWIKSMAQAASDNTQESVDIASRITSLVKQLDEVDAGDTIADRSQRLEAALQLTIELASRGFDQPKEISTAIEALARSKDPLISSLFEAHLPPTARQRRLSPGAQYAEIADLAGDAGRGKAYFLDQTRSQCSKCHRIGDQGGRIGPALDDIGRRQSPNQIFESLVDPSRVIDPKFQSHIVIRTDGQVITGLLESETNSEVVLVNSQGEKIKLLTDDIDTRKIDTKSLMPSGMVAEMTAQQAADLIAFLSTLKSNEPAAKAAPEKNSTSQLRIDKNDQTLTVLQGDKPILVYNLQSPPAPAGIDKVYERSGFLHPVYTPAGQVLTAAFPADHAHQHGIFAAWVKTKYRGQAVDFWNLAGKTGRVLHEQLVSTGKTEDGGVSFEVDLLHRALLEPAVDVLRERWKVSVHPTDGSYYCFDLQTSQNALTDEPLVVEKYHYGGVAFRGNVRWVLPKDSEKAKLADTLEPNEITNSLGQQRIEGNHGHARWVAIGGQLNSRPASLVMLDHPRNYRSPQAARLHPTKPYFVYSPCVDGEFSIDKQYPYQARYRFLITDKALDKKWVDDQWGQWAKQ